MKFISQSHDSINKNTELHQLARSLLKPNVIPVNGELIQLAVSQSLGPMFLHRLHETDTPIDHLPNKQMLLTDSKEKIVLHLLQEKAIREVSTTLESAGIRCVWLKGAALGYSIYPLPHLRTKRDLDCIVSIADFPNALQSLLNTDYIQFEDLATTTGHERFSHHAHLVHARQHHVHLELHHRLLGHDRRNDLPPELLANWIDQAMPFEMNGWRFFVLKPEHHTLYLCAHGFLQHGESHVNLRDLFDIHLLLSQKNFNWTLLIQQTIDLKWIFLMNYTLRMIHDYFGTVIPEHVFNTLQNHQLLDLSQDRMILKSYGDVRGENSLQFLSQLSFRKRIEMVRKIVLPTESYMRQKYSIPSNRSTLPYYIYRIAYQSKGIFVAILRRMVLFIRQMFRAKLS